MDNRPAIFLVTSEFPPLPGGIGNHAWNLARELRDAGYEVLVHTESRNSEDDLEDRFDRESGLPVLRVSRHRFLPMTIWRRIKLYRVGIKRLPADRTIVIASGKFSLWLAGVFSIFYSRPHAAVLHGVEINLSNRWLNGFTYWCLRRLDLLVAVSNFTREVMLSHDGTLQVEVINNGFAPLVSLPDSGIPQGIKGDPALITVGNVTYRKGQHNVIRALPLLSARYPEIHYHIVGIPTGRAKLEVLAKELGVADRVTFYGAVSAVELRRLLTASHVFCMLSDHDRQGDFEGFGIAILEANDLGVPAIGAANSGIADAIANGKNGQLVDPRDPGSVLQGLIAILEDYPGYVRRAREWATQFRWAKVIEQYLEKFKSLP